MVPLHTFFFPSICIKRQYQTLKIKTGLCCWGRTASRTYKLYTYKIMADGFIEIICNYNRGKISLAAGCHGVMVHGIAQLAIFCNGLFGLYIAVMAG